MDEIPSSRGSTGLQLVLAVMFFLTLGLMLIPEGQASGWRWELILNALLLAVPIGLIYLTAGLLITAARRRGRDEPMGARLSGWIYHLPRVAAVLMTTFVALFALDVFEMDGTILQKLGAFVLHALPAVLLAVFLSFSWRREWLGFGLFLAAALGFLFTVVRSLMGGMPGMGLGNLFVFVLPLASIAALFWANWKWKADLARPQLPGR